MGTSSETAPDAHQYQQMKEEVSRMKQEGKAIPNFLMVEIVGSGSSQKPKFYKKVKKKDKYRERGSATKEKSSETLTQVEISELLQSTNPHQGPIAEKESILWPADHNPFKKECSVRDDALAPENENPPKIEEQKSKP